jgi:hypothetical protein
MGTFVCSQCGNPASVPVHADDRCTICGAVLPHEEGTTSAAETHEHDENIAPAGPSSEHRGPEWSPESPWPDVKIRCGRGSETLAVLALLMPALAVGVLLAWRFESATLDLAVSYGTVILTALMLAADAALLGSIDLQGHRRASPLALFFGMIFLWIIFYPAAFFRRRHFGRPNLGLLAILVAVFFVAVPFLHDFKHLGVFGNGVPTCDSPEVVSMVEDIIRKGSAGPSVQSVSGYREISYDPVNQTRKGQCLVKTRNETITATYTVKVMNRDTGVFKVEVEPVVTEDPPSCTDPEVIALVERLIRDGLNGGQLKSVEGHREIRYDQENKTRHGHCRAAVLQFMQDRTVEVAYKVYWLNKKTGQYQVEIEPE